jgi:hypothetical protein
MENSITVYWSPKTSGDIDTADWSFLYPKPRTLFASIKEHLSDKNTEVEYVAGSNILACPSISTKTKKIIVFNSPMSASYKYKILENNECEIEPISKEYLGYSIVRQPTLDYGPSINFSLGYYFFSEEPLDAYFTPPMFHPTQYTKYGAPVFGEFDIGQWFRPFNVEIQMWEREGEFHIKEGEPLFYVELKTDKKIILKRFNLTQKLHKMGSACIESFMLFGKGESFEDRYRRFNDSNMREIILDEIKKNIVNEDNPLTI